MNDNALYAATGARNALQGLPQRLVADGLVADGAMVDAVAAAKERRISIVTYLVEHNLADAREIAIAASQEFGAPLLDLDAIQPDLETVRIVSEKILRKHRVLPLVKRGKKLFLGHFRPDQPARAGRGQVRHRLLGRGDRRRGRQARAAAHPLARAGRHDDAGAGRRRLRDGQSRGQRRRRRDQCRGRGSVGRRRRADRPLRQQGDAGRHPARRLGHPLRALRAILPHPLPARRRAEGSRRAAGAARLSSWRPASRSCPGSTSPSGASRRTAASR